MSKIINIIFTFVIRAYRMLISPLFPSSCRYYPTCSSYAIDAFDTFPWYRALWMSIKRIGRCHPWHEGGYDPVPDPKDSGMKHG